MKVLPLYPKKNRKQIREQERADRIRSWRAEGWNGSKVGRTRKIFKPVQE